MRAIVFTRRIFVCLVVLTWSTVSFVKLQGQEFSRQCGKLNFNTAGDNCSSQASPPKPMPLRSLIDEAEQGNPEISAAEHGWLSATHVGKQVAAFPDTQVSIQQFSVGSPRPFAGFSNSDFAYIGFGASQEIPYPGKRSLRGQVADLAADSLHSEAESVRRQIIEKLKVTYFQLAYIQQTLSVLQRDTGLLNDIEQIAESRYRVGQGNQQDVLKAQLQRTKILQEITMHHREESQLEAQLKQLLNRSQDSPDISTEPLKASALSYSSQKLLQLAIGQNPDIHAHSATVQKEQTQTQLARKDFRPDFNVQYMYEHTGDKFRDYYIATFGINLPNRGRRRAELSEATEKRAQANAELDAEKQRIAAELQNQYVVAQASAEQLKIYQDGLMPQSQATFRSALAAYQVNQQDFETLLSSFMDVLDFDLQYQRELADHESALARLEALTGVTLP